MDQTLYFKIEKETKGAVRYKEIDRAGNDAFAPVIGTLYVRKSAMPGKVIPEITVIIKAS